MTQILVACHVLANLAWIGSILAVGFLVARSTQPDSAGFGRAASAVYRKISAPSFGASFVVGMVLLVREPAYLKMGWFHAKLTVALVAIALHHVIGARAKRAADGELEGKLEGKSGSQAAVMTVVLGIGAAAAVFLVMLRPF